MSNYEFVTYDEKGREVRLASGELAVRGHTYDPGDTVVLKSDDVERPWKVVRSEGTKIVVEAPGD